MHNQQSVRQLPLEKNPFQHTKPYIICVYQTPVENMFSVLGRGLQENGTKIYIQKSQVCTQSFVLIKMW